MVESGPQAPGHLRADARRNRDRLVDAARWLFVEQGMDVPLEAIAVRADVGIGTLYRRFRDREALIDAVVLDTIDRFVSVTAEAVAAEREGAQGFTQFVRGTEPIRLGVLLPMLAPVVAERREASGELWQASERAIDLLGELITLAQANGHLRSDVGIKDVLLLVALVTRPMGGLSEEHWEALSPRLLHLLLEGLRAEGSSAAPPPPDPATWFDPRAEEQGTADRGPTGR